MSTEIFLLHSVYHVFSKTTTTQLFMNVTLPLLSTSILKTLLMFLQSFPLVFTLEFSIFNGKLFRANLRLSSRWPPEMTFVYKQVFSGVSNTNRSLHILKSLTKGKTLNGQLWLVSKFQIYCVFL